MHEVSYRDSKGRYWLVSLPDGMPDSDASLGIPLGPPSLENLDYPESVSIELHNQLFSRRIFTLLDAKRKRADIVAAIQGALKLDADRIVQLYQNWELGNNEAMEQPMTQEEVEV